MLKKIINRETIVYIVFGIGTTIINYGLFTIFLYTWGQEYVLWINIVAFLGATLFAYITNKKFVFLDNNWRFVYVIGKFVEFTISRLFSLAVEQIGLWGSMELLAMGNKLIFGIEGLIVCKIILSFVSVIINYFLSKFIIFRKVKQNESINNNSGI